MQMQMQMQRQMQVRMQMQMQTPGNCRPVACCQSATSDAYRQLLGCFCLGIQFVVIAVCLEYCAQAL